MPIVIERGPAVEAVASFLDCSLDVLADRDRFVDPVGRWLARSGNGADAVGLATAFVRPDRRLFLTHRLLDERAFEPLTKAAVSELEAAGSGPIHVTVSGTDSEAAARRTALGRLGFNAESGGRTYEVPFAAALARRWPDRLRGLTVQPADRVDPDALFALDTLLRSDTPGNDGWEGRRSWFDDELAGPEFDPEAYPVALDAATGTPVGLCRIWRNEDGPALGLIGVVPEHRSGRVAAVLAHRALRAAAAWGSPTFTTSTARPALQRRLGRLGAIETGGFVRFRR
jgi:GNAT superfamily N-acetyltransferase